MGMQRRFLASALALLVVVCLAGVATAETLRGAALVIGQSKYEHLEQLPNPVNDARGISELLTQLGFAVQMAEDQTADKLSDDIATFVAAADGADVALVYYSGHGFEAGGENYLVPVDTDPAKPDATEEDLVRLSALLASLERRAKITILLIDACRTSPFPPGTKLTTADDPAGVEIGANGLGIPRGAVVLASGGTSDNLGQVIGYAAEPGRAALDGEAGGNSPYAAALMKHFAVGERNFSDVMTMVTEEVYLKTRSQQRPWTNASLRRLLYFGGEAERLEGDEALLRGARRELLLSISSTPEVTRSYVERLAGREGLPLDALYGMLEELDVDTSAGPAQIGRQLRDGAANLKKFLAERITPARNDPELNRLAGLAARAEEEGAIGLAKKYRALASVRADELSVALDGREGELSADRLELAAVYADHAETAILTFDYELAADRYAEAFEQAENWDEDLAFRYKLGEADAMTTLGAVSADQDMLRDAIDVYQDALDLVPRRKKPLDWAEARANMAGAHWSLGRLEDGLESFEIALEAYREVLKERPREEVPVLWAKTQNNIGNVLSEFGLRLEGTKLLKQAAKAYRQALKVFSPEYEPSFFAITQSNIGNVLAEIGSRGKGTRNLNKAVEALTTALKHQSPEDEPLAWIAAKRNLGNTYLAIGERVRDVEKMELAIQTFREALEVQNRDQMPAEWATSQISLGDAYKEIGKLTGEPDPLNEAVAAYEASLPLWTFEETPRHWAKVMLELGKAKLEIGKLMQDRDIVLEGMALVEKARDAFLDAGHEQHEAFFAAELEPFDKALKGM